MCILILDLVKACEGDWKSSKNILTLNGDLTVINPMVESKHMVRVPPCSVPYENCDFGHL